MDEVIIPVLLAFITPVLLAFITMILTAILVAVAWPPHKKHCYDDRVEKFKVMRKKLKEENRRVRKKIPTDEFDEGYPYLLHLNEWNHQKNTPLKQIDDVIVLEADDDFKDNYSDIMKYIRKKILLPKKKRSILDNIKLIEGDETKLYESAIFSVSSIDPKSKITLKIKKGTYYGYLNTCFGYGFEAAYETINDRNEFKLHQKYPLMDFSKRIAAIGTVTLTIIKPKSDKNGMKQCYCLIHERSDSVAESRGLNDAVPAGTFEPASINAEKKVSDALKDEGIKRTVIREFLEEILGIEEFSEMANPKYLEKTDAWEMLKDNIFYLGFGLDPINTHLILLMCTVIDMEKDIVKRTFGISDNESEIINKIVSSNCNFEGKIRLKPFNRDTLEFYKNSRHSTPSLSQICAIILDDYDNFSSQFDIK